MSCRKWKRHVRRRSLRERFVHNVSVSRFLCQVPAWFSAPQRFCFICLPVHQIRLNLWGISVIVFFTHITKTDMKVECKGTLMHIVWFSITFCYVCPILWIEFFELNKFKCCFYKSMHCVSAEFIRSYRDLFIFFRIPCSVVVACSQRGRFYN